MEEGTSVEIHMKHMKEPTDKLAALTGVLSLIETRDTHRNCVICELKKHMPIDLLNQL